MTRTQRAGLRRACREEAECISCSLRNGIVLIITAGPHGSGTNAWAVDTTTSPTEPHALILRWNGTGWSRS